MLTLYSISRANKIVKILWKRVSLRQNQGCSCTGCHGPALGFREHPIQPSGGSALLFLFAKETLMAV